MSNIKSNDEIILYNNPNLQKEEEKEKSPTTIDIFQHMKLNIKPDRDICTCNDTVKYYCIPCKVSTCEGCNLNNHKNHLLVNKSEVELDKEKIDIFFDKADKNIQSSPIVFNPDETKQSIINNLDEFITDINEKVKRFKQIKLQEIEKLFSRLSENASNIKNRSQATRENLKHFIEKNKRFFNLSTKNSFTSKENSINFDKNNTYFLINYDLYNIIFLTLKEIKLVIERVEREFKSYKENQSGNYEKMKNDIESILFLKENEPQQKKTKFADNKKAGNLKIKETQDKDKEKEKEKIICDDQSDLSSSNIRFNLECTNLGKDHFEPINLRLKKYNNQIETFKKGVYNTYIKSGNLKDVERQLSVFEKAKQKGADGLFSERVPPDNYRAKLTSERSNYSLHYTAKEDICLNSPLLQEYFSHLIMDLYGKNFRMESKELQSSHADLMIKSNENEDDIENDYGKVIEGTNQILIYEKRNNKVTKIPVKLTKNPFGYTKFPYGSRCLLIADKLYIAGGKDEQNEYPNVLIYDRKRNLLKRIIDLQEPRSYHTMIYSEVFETIIVLGGENRNSVEIFDPLTNRWQFLPEMNYPRANACFYFDKPKGIIYCMFGIEGSLVGEKYSEVIEYLDLSDVKARWNILDYRNKSQMDLKNYINIYPLKNDMILLYGGVGFRNNKKSVCVLNLTKKEVTKVDNKLLEELRIQAKNSRRLNSIMSSLSLISTSLK